MAAHTHVCVYDFMLEGELCCICRRGPTRIVRAMCVSAHAYTAAHVYVCMRACSWKHRWCFEFVRACAWHLAWHVRVTLLVVHVHARIYARMRIRASRGAQMTLL